MMMVLEKPLPQLLVMSRGKVGAVVGNIDDNRENLMAVDDSKEKLMTVGGS